MAESALAQNELLAIEKPVARISWGGIFIGAFSTLALGILLNSLGAAIGLSAINPAQGQWGTSIATGIWSFLSIVVATFFGAWIASRASTVFFKRDAGVLGFMTWALSFLAMLAFVLLIVNATAASTLQAAGAASQAAPLGQLQQQAQQMQPGQIAENVAKVGAAGSWWFFITALCSMLAGVFGGMAGLPRGAKEGKAMEVRRGAGTMRQREA